MESEAAANSNQLVADRERTISAAVVGKLIGAAAVMSVYLVRAYSLASVDEDAYISFRYARNLLNRDGLVFNPGERVEGITNLLWTLALAAGSWASGLSLPTVALTLGALCGALTLLVAYRWCCVELCVVGIPQRVASYAALIPPLLITLAAGFVPYSVSGLETPLFTLLITSGLYALSRAGSLHWCAVGSALLGAAALTRPDGLLFLAFGIVACAIQLRSGGITRMAAVTLPGAAIVLSATLWRLWYYGSPVPNTFFAKAGGYTVMERWGYPYLMDAAQTNWFYGAFLLALVGALLNRKFLTRNLAAFAVVPAWCAYVVYVGGDYMPASRFFIPLLPVLYVLAIPGAALVHRMLLARTSFSAHGKLAFAILPILAFSAAFAAPLPGQLQAEIDHKAQNTRFAEYRKSVATWINSQNPDALVAANAVGVLGYYADARIVDMLGLNDAHIAHNGTRDAASAPGHQVGDGRYVLSREPDYIFPFSIKPEFQWETTEPYFVGDKELAELPEFKNRYELRVVKLESGQTLSVFERKSATH